MTTKVFVVLVGGNIQEIRKSEGMAHFVADQEIVNMACDKDRFDDFDLFDEDLQRLLNGAKADGGLCVRDSKDLIVLWNDFCYLGEYPEMAVEVKEFPVGA
jgi:hypothetical protein